MKTTVVLLFMVVAITAVDLPNGFKVCKPLDPDIKNCVSEAIKTALSVLANGNSALKILPLEPLAIDYLRINGSGLISLTQEYWNIKIHGVTKNVQVFIRNFDVNTFEHHEDIFFPQLNITSDYELNGNVLLLPIKGKGKSRLMLYNTTMTLDINYERYEKNGETYLRIKKLDYQIKDTNVKIYLGNLFGGDPRLGEEMNRILNENSKALFNESKSAYEEIFKRIIAKVCNIIYSNIPLKKIFPPN